MLLEIQYEVNCNHLEGKKELGQLEVGHRICIGGMHMHKAFIHLWKQ